MIATDSTATAFLGSRLPEQNGRMQRQGCADDQQDRNSQFASSACINGTEDQVRQSDGPTPDDWRIGHSGGGCPRDRYFVNVTPTTDDAGMSTA